MRDTVVHDDEVEWDHHGLMCEESLDESRHNNKK